MLLTFAGALFGVIVLFACGQWILGYWTGGNIEVPLLLIGLMALWTVVECCGGGFAMFLNGVGVVRPQVVVVAFFCVLVLPLKILGISQIGLIAVPLVTVLVYTVTLTYFYGFVFIKEIKAFTRMTQHKN